MSDHPTIVAVADCGCLWGAAVLGYGEDVSAYRAAANWAKRGAIVRMIPSSHDLPPLRCADHPDGRWANRRRGKR